MKELKQLQSFLNEAIQWEVPPIPVFSSVREEIVQLATEVGVYHHVFNAASRVLKEVINYDYDTIYYEYNGTVYQATHFDLEQISKDFADQAKRLVDSFWDLISEHNKGRSRPSNHKITRLGEKVRFVRENHLKIMIEDTNKIKDNQCFREREKNCKSTWRKREYTLQGLADKLQDCLSEAIEMEAPPIFSSVQKEIVELNHVVSEFKDASQKLEDKKHSMENFDSYKSGLGNLETNTTHFAGLVDQDIDSYRVLIAEHNVNKGMSIFAKPSRSLNRKITRLGEKVKYRREYQLKPLIEDAKLITVYYDGDKFSRPLDLATMGWRRRWQHILQVLVDELQVNLAEAMEKEVSPIFSSVQSGLVELNNLVKLFKDVASDASKELENETYVTDSAVEYYEEVLRNLELKTMNFADSTEDIIDWYWDLMAEHNKGRFPRFLNLMLDRLGLKLMSIREDKLKPLIEDTKNIMDMDHNQDRSFHYSPRTGQHILQVPIDRIHASLAKAIEMEMPPIFSSLQLEIVKLNNLVIVFKDVSKQIRVERSLCRLEMETRNIAEKLDDIIDSYWDMRAEHNKGIPTRFLNPKIDSFQEKLKSIREDKLEPLLKDAKWEAGVFEFQSDFSPGAAQVDYTVLVMKLQYCLTKAMETEVSPIFFSVRREIAELDKEIGVFENVASGMQQNTSELSRERTMLRDYITKSYGLAFRDLVRNTENITSSYLALVAEYEKGRCSPHMFPKTRSLKAKVTSLKEKLKLMREDQLKPVIEDAKTITVDEILEIQSPDQAAKKGSLHKILEELISAVRVALANAVQIEVPSIFSCVRTEMAKLDRQVCLFEDIARKACKMLEDQVLEMKKHGIQQTRDHIQVYEATLRDLYRKTRSIAAYEAVDLVDYYLVLTAEYNKGGMCNMFPRTTTQKSKIASLEGKFKCIRELQLEQLLKDSKKIANNGYPIRPFDYSPSTTQPQGTAVQIKQEPPNTDYIFGLKEDTDKAVRSILYTHDKYKCVYLISGMPGVGKTTLASKIFYDPRIKKEFPVIIWASSFEDMIVSIREKLSMQEVPVEEFAKKIEECLELGGKKLLVFLDDIATSEECDKIKKALPTNYKLHKVVMTSSNSDVTCWENRVKLQCMDENKGWDFLHLQVYGVEDDASLPKLERIGKCIVKECGGLPHAIALIGRFLKDKLSSIDRNSTAAVLRIWEDVAERVKDYLFDPSVPDNMGTLLSKYYNELSFKQRDCLLYLAMHPDDVKVPESKLSRLLSAEGFDELGSLTEMNWLHKQNFDNESCLLHTLVQEFCTRKVESSGKDISFFRQIRHQNGAFKPPIQELDGFHGLCINSSVDKFLSQEPKLPNVRSFVCFSNKSITLEKKHIKSIINASKLRVYHANTVQFPNFPTKISGLHHLRYLLLSGDKIHVLPRSISKWRNIKTIIVKTMSRTLKIEADIWEMKQLSLLKTKAAIILNKDDNVEGEGCEKLKILGYLSPQSCTDQVAGKAKNLNKLGIRGPLAKLVGSTFLQKLDKVMILKLVNEGNHHRLLRLPPCTRFPPGLMYLSLSSTFLDWKHMSTIASLNLVVLRLIDEAFVGNSWDTTSGGFLELQWLEIKGSNLMHWTASTDSFPKLEFLNLISCKELEEVPLELGNKLLNVNLKNVSEATIASAKEIQHMKLLIDDPKEGFSVKSVMGGF